MEHLQIVDLSPHLGHKLVAALQLKFDYLGLIIEPGDSIEGIASMMIGLFEEREIKAMKNPGRVVLVKVKQEKKKKRKIVASFIASTVPKKKQKIVLPPPLTVEDEENLFVEEGDKDGNNGSSKESI